MKKTAIKSSQVIIFILIRCFFAGRVKVKVLGDKKIVGPVIIAANHARGYDPFVIGCFLPAKTFFRVFPFCFMTANMYYHSVWKPLAWLAGCYPAKKKSDLSPRGSYGVGYSIKSFGDGCTVMMFPEGKRTRRPSQAKPGISWILDQTKGKLLLCHIEWSKTGWLQTARITFKQADSRDIKDPQSIINAIYDLPVSQKTQLATKSA